MKKIVLMLVLVGLTCGCIEEKEEPAAKTSEIGEGTAKVFTYGNEPVILINLNGSYHAYLGKCPSRSGTAFDSKSLVNNTLRCPDGTLFDPATGNYIGQEDGTDLNLSGLMGVDLDIDGENIYIKEPQADVCGNKRCGAGESEENCCSDCGCREGKCMDNKCTKVKMNISTDKELYRSKQTANITLSIDSSEEIGNVTVKVYGINARGRYHLNNEVNMNLTAGENIKSITYQMPSCTGCAGISPGTYNIRGEIIYNSEIIANATKNIEIQQ